MNKSSSQGGEARADKWAWVEATVGTERMLKALEKGVKGGKWFSLMDKVYAPANLEAAWKKVKGNRGAAGVDRQSVRKFSQIWTEQKEAPRESRVVNEGGDRLSHGLGQIQGRKVSFPWRNCWIPDLTPETLGPHWGTSERV